MIFSVSIDEEQVTQNLVTDFSWKEEEVDEAMIGGSLFYPLVIVKVIIAVEYQAKRQHFMRLERHLWSIAS